MKSINPLEGSMNPVGGSMNPVGGGMNPVGGGINPVGGGMNEDQYTAVQDLQKSVRNIKRTEGAVLLFTAVAGLLTCSFFAGKKLERDRAKEQEPVTPPIKGARK